MNFRFAIATCAALLTLAWVSNSTAQEQTEPVSEFPKIEFSARIMTGFEVEHETPEGAQSGDEETEMGFFLQQARAKLKVQFNEKIKLNLSAEFADAIDLAEDLNSTSDEETTDTIDSCDAIDFSDETPELYFLRNAYINFEFHDAFQVRAGHYKLPFSRMRLRSTGDLPFRGRGLSNGVIIKDTGFGGRSLGTMLWGRIKSADLTWNLSASNPGWDFIDDQATNGINATARLTYDPKKWLSIGINGGYQYYDYVKFSNTDIPGASLVGFGGDLRFKMGGLYVAAEAIAGQRHIIDPRHEDPGVCTETRQRNPFAFGITGYASYNLNVTELLDLQPMIFGEYADSDSEFIDTEAIRTVLGFNLLVGDHLRIMPQVEIIRPLSVTDYTLVNFVDPIDSPLNEWEARETYYLMVSLSL